MIYLLNLFCFFCFWDPLNLPPQSLLINKAGKAGLTVRDRVEVKGRNSPWSWGLRFGDFHKVTRYKICISDIILALLVAKKLFGTFAYRSSVLSSPLSPLSPPLLFACLLACLLNNGPNTHDAQDTAKNRRRRRRGTKGMIFCHSPSLPSPPSSLLARCSYAIDIPVQIGRLSRG